jgi:MFS family permease
VEAGNARLPAGIPHQRTPGRARSGAGPRAQLAALRGAPPKSRRAMRSAYAGFLLDMYDVYVPVVALAPAIAYFQPGDVTNRQKTVVYFVTFAVTLLGRPLGAAVFGHLADRWGRRSLTLVSVAGFSLVSAVIACLPGFAQLGWLAVGLLITLRFLGGIFLGGEYTAATPLAFEHCPHPARGLFGGILISAFALSYMVTSALVVALLGLMPHDGPGSAYAQWGWRVPFALGALLGAVFLAYRRRVPESDLWQTTVRVHRPVQEVLTGRSAAQFRQVFLLMSGLWFAGSGVVSVMPALLLTQREMPATTVTGVMLVASAALGAAMLATGVLGQMFGRRRVLLVCATVAAGIGCPLYVALAAVTAPSTTAVTAMATLVVVAAMAGWGVVTPYLIEQFPTAVRSSGFGLGYTLAIAVPSLFPLWMWALGHVMPYRYTQVVLLGLGTVLMAAGAWSGPETRDTDLDRVDFNQPRGGTIGEVVGQPGGVVLDEPEKRRPAGVLPRQAEEGQSGH